MGLYISKKTGEHFDIPDNEADQAEASGKFEQAFKLRSKKTGEDFVVPASEAELAMKTGKFDFSETADIRKNVGADIKRLQENPLGLPEAIASPLQTFGDTMHAAGENAFGGGIVSKLGSAATAAVTDKSYSQLRDEAKKQSEEEEARSPIGTLVGTLAGSAADPFGKLMAASKGAKVGEIAAKTAGRIGLNVADAASRAENVGQLKENAAMAGGVSAGFEALPYAAKGLGKAGKVAATWLLGMDKGEIDHYIANKAAVNSSKTIEQLKDTLDDEVGKFSAKTSEASDALQNAKGDATSAQFAARDARKQALADAKAAEIALREKLRNVKPPDSMADDLILDINSKSKDLGELSGQAFDVLAEQGHSFKAGKLKAAITSRINEMKIAGVSPEIGGSGQAVKELAKFRAYVDTIGKKNNGEISAPDVKSLIKLLDEASQGAYDTSAGALAPKAQKALASVRSGFNKVLRNSSEEYRSVMDDLAPKTGLISDMSDVFGDKASAIGAINAMSDQKGAKGRLAKELLSKYDDMHNTNFVGQLNDYFHAQDLIKNPTKFNAARDSLSEFERLKTQLPEELSSVSKSESVLSSKQALDAAKENEGRFSKIRNNSTESTARGTRKNIERTRQLEDISKESGINFPEEIKNSQTKAAFDRSNINGSRRTTPLTIIGQSLGTALGAVGGGLAGAGAGFVAGMVLDKHGGKMVKWAIDNAPKYADVFRKAQERGGNAMAVTHFLLMQKDPEYKATVENADANNQ